MFELHTPQAPPRRPVSLATMDVDQHEPGPAPRWLMCMLDEVDYGMLLLTGDSQLAYANRAARRDLGGTHPLQLVSQTVLARRPQDATALQAALGDAARQGRRRMLLLGAGEDSCSIAVVPLPASEGNHHPVLLLLGRHRVCEELSVDNFARGHGLTLAETQVLKGLCVGLQPQEVALRQGVAMSTVRTQIGSIREKTGTQSIRALLAQVAQLPPMVSVVEGCASMPMAA